MSDTQFLLGKLVEGDPERDAVHIAVAPVVARELLAPGTNVGLYEGRATALVDSPIGIVDPFLKKAVKCGETFWMFLYPNSITSLKHLWTHPAFAEQPATARSSSEEWMRSWAMEHMSEDYYGDGEKFSPERAYANAIEAGHSHSVGPYEDARDHIDNEWWSHWEAITGQRGDRDEYFRCAC